MIHEHRLVDGTQAPLCAGHTRAPKETLQGREPSAGLAASCRLLYAKWGWSRTSHTGGTRGCGESRPGTLVLERTNQEGELGKFWQLWPPAPPSVGENKRPAKSPALASEVPLPGPPGLTWKPTHIPPPPLPPTHTPSGSQLAPRHFGGQRETEAGGPGQARLTDCKLVSCRLLSPPPRPLLRPRSCPGTPCCPTQQLLPHSGPPRGASLPAATHRCPRGRPAAAAASRPRMNTPVSSSPILAFAHTGPPACSALPVDRANPCWVPGVGCCPLHAPTPWPALPA